MLASSNPYVRPGSGFDVQPDTWADTHLIDASCSVLPFDQEDENIRNTSESVAGQPSSTDIRFSRPLKAAPKPDAIKGRYIRLDVKATSIDLVSG